MLTRIASTLLALAIGGTTLLALAPAASASTTDSAEAAFVADLNSLRVSQHLPTVVVDTRLVAMARAWSGTMAAAGDISHNPALTSQAPSDWKALGENVGLGPNEPMLHDAFVNSPHHYANMVNPSFNAVGVGVVMANTTMFVTVDFAQLPPQTLATFVAAPSGNASSAAAASGSGWLAASDGGIFAFGRAAFLGSMGGRHLNQPVVGMAAMPSGNGYWLVARDGGIFNFGDARFFGSTGSIALNQPIVGMASTPSGNGYWLVARDGGIFAFGDAPFFGSTGSMRLNRPIVGIGQAAAGGGYWLVASDGGLFGFGSAGFYGSTASSHLAQPVVGMTATPSGQGYVLASADGNVFAFGDATSYGSPTGLGGAVIGITASAATGGYQLGTSAGQFLTVSASGSSQAGTGPLSQAIVAITSLP